MKKLFVLSVIAALFAFSSCKKECACTSYLNDEEIAKTTVEHKGKCSELDSKTTVGTVTSEVKCK